MINHNIDFNKASFKEFENIPHYDIVQSANAFQEFTDYMSDQDQMNFRFVTAGCGPVVQVKTPFMKAAKECISLVSNDYLNFTQHPKVKQAAIDGIMKYGTGAGASRLLEDTTSTMCNSKINYPVFLIDKGDHQLYIQQDTLQMQQPCNVY
ncbi:hypothetical protein OKW96_00820 [Sphingobacterium sp. KU25419]|nr:hypothetical protein OKW96_00820 [Sphingobacterium sp. KU25419]